MKKAFGVLLVLALVLCLSMTAFAAEAEADTTEVYQNKITPEKYELVINEDVGETLVEMDVANNEYKVVEANGNYYLGDDQGPQIWVNLNHSLMSIQEMLGSGKMSTPIYALAEDGTWLKEGNAPVVTKTVDFTDAMNAYITNADDGYCPLTTDLAYMIQTYGLNNGWWGKVVDPSLAWYIFYAEDDWQTQIDVGEDVWLYACAYVKPCDHANATKVDAVKPCHDVGNIEYWHCPDCDGYWTDAALTKVTNALSVNLPETGEGNVEHVEKLDPTCHDVGNVEYWHCLDCDRYWTDEKLTQLTNGLSVNLPEKGSDKLEHVAAVKPCHDVGNVEYWYCAECERYWLDEALTKVTNALSVNLPETGEGNVEYVAKLDPTCHNVGNVEYWHCLDCDRYWTDEKLTQLTNALSVILPEKGSNYVEHIEAAESVCHEPGNVEYWHCLECDGYWTDEALTKTSNALRVKLPAKVKLQLQEALEPTCHQEGWTEHWYCPECGANYKDAQGNIPDTRFMLPAKGSHYVEHVEAAESVCHELGNIEYWHCAECDGYWTDEALTKTTNALSVKLPAKVKLQHQEALAPTCHQEGWTEYWYCPECESCYCDAQGNIPNTRYMLPATGSENVEHVAAKAPTATATGNVEYWHCKDCDGYWTDKDLTKISNVKSVILPVTDPSPATGDNSFVVAFGVLMVLSVAGAAVLVVSKKKFDK